VTSQDSSCRRPTRVGGLAGALGVLASLACTAAMTLPVLGVAGAAAAAGARGAGGMDSMSSMYPAGGGDSGGLLGWLLTYYGPALLVVSIVLVTLSVAVRRPLAAVPALLWGALLYWGMYGQPSYPVMYLTLALGYAGWIGTYLWAATRPDRRPSRSPRPDSPGVPPDAAVATAFGATGPRHEEQSPGVSA